MKRAHILGAMFILLVTFATGAAAQNGVVTTTVTLQASDSFTSPCSGEVVDYNGSVQLVTYVWKDGNGALHTRNKVPTLNVKGVGETSQNVYIVQAGGGSVEMTNADGILPVEQTSITRFAVIGTGAVPNYWLLMVFHQTVNPDLTITSEVEQMVERCK